MKNNEIAWSLSLIEKIGSYRQIQNNISERKIYL